MQQVSLQKIFFCEQKMFLTNAISTFTYSLIYIFLILEPMCTARPDTKLSSASGDRIKVKTRYG